MYRPLLLLLLLCTACARKGPVPSAGDPVKHLEALSIDAIDTMHFAPAPAADYVRMTDYALRLKADTARNEQSVKGEVLLTALAAHLRSELDSGRLDPVDAQVTALIGTYHQNQFFIYQPRPSDFIKLAHYACNGDYAYIHSRMVHRWYFWPLVAGAAALLAFYAATFYPFSGWRKRKRTRLLLSYVLVMTVLLAILFKSTCHKYVTQHTFYGIRL
ncbi:hypothetical protein [Flaviaesturariibacter amylovorans]|uniref:Lipoprotein n=1 Tax=Flaviaesturariibacter amylovorans TaxID=1084520 RepID=A0ABP8G6Z9_9BACT